LPISAREWSVAFLSGVDREPSDDHHFSFSVNAEKNYWHCFAGFRGGSLIDFWMKWQGIEFRQAVKELAKQLL
jgi:DNA primase